SLLAVRLISRIRTALGVELPIRAVFESPTVSGISERLLGAEAGRRAVKRVVPRPESIPLSYAQQRLWFLQQLEGGGATYHIPRAVRLRGVLDVEALERALGDVVGRHESLRTVFATEEGVPRQRVLDAGEAGPVLHRQMVDGRELREAMAAAIGRGFDLEREIPLRGHVYELGRDEHVLLLVLHNIAGDGWSMRPLLRDVGQAYAARREGREPGWSPLPVQYADYTLWQRGVLGEDGEPGSAIGEQLRWWTEQLSGLPEQLELPTDRPRPAVSSHAGGTVGLRVEPELHGRLLELGRGSQASLFMVLQAGVSVLLSGLGCGTDIVLGSPVAGRMDEALEELVGFFVNTLVLRTDTSGDPSFRELVGRVRRGDLEAYARQEIPFERLVEALNPERSLGRHPLFQVMLVLQNTPEGSLQLPGLEVSRERSPTGGSKFDLVFSGVERYGPDGKPHGLDLAVTYSADLFDVATAEALGERLLRVLR